MEGTYFTGGQMFSYSNSQSHILSISGGWYYDHDPCDFQHARADATVLDGQNVTAVLGVASYLNAPGTSLSISNLPLRNGATSTNGESAALAMFGGSADLRVQNVVVLSSHNNTPGPAFNIFTNVVTCRATATSISSTMSSAIPAALTLTSQYLPACRHKPYTCTTTRCRSIAAALAPCLIPTAAPHYAS